MAHGLAPCQTGTQKFSWCFVLKGKWNSKRSVVLSYHRQFKKHWMANYKLLRIFHDPDNYTILWLEGLHSHGLPRALGCGLFVSLPRCVTRAARLALYGWILWKQCWRYGVLPYSEPRKDQDQDIKFGKLRRKSTLHTCFFCSLKQIPYHLSVKQPPVFLDGCNLAMPCRGAGRASARGTRTICISSDIVSTTQDVTRSSQKDGCLCDLVCWCTL